MDQATVSRSSAFRLGETPLPIAVRTSSASRTRPLARTTGFTVGASRRRDLRQAVLQPHEHARDSVHPLGRPQPKTLHHQVRQAGGNLLAKIHRRWVALLLHYASVLLVYGEQR